jgi:hypothetical protein
MIELDEQIRTEAEKRFHMAVSFVRWYELSGTEWKSRQTPLDSTRLVHFLEKQKDIGTGIEALLYPNGRAPLQALTKATHAFCANGLFPERLGKLFGRTYIKKTPLYLQRRQEDNEEILKLLKRFFSRALVDYQAWGEHPEQYRSYVDVSAAMAIIEDRSPRISPFGDAKGDRPLL